MNVRNYETNKTELITYMALNITYTVLYVTKSNQILLRLIIKF